MMPEVALTNVFTIKPRRCSVSGDRCQWGLWL